MVLNPFPSSKHDSNTAGARFFEKKIGQIPATFSRRGNSSASVDTSIHLHHTKNHWNTRPRKIYMVCKLVSNVF